MQSICIAEIIEKAVCKQLASYLDANNLMSRNQSAHRRNHSTESALTKVFSNFMSAIDIGNFVLLSLLDLLAAFDCVDHEILLNSLGHYFSMQSKVLKWLTSYLTGRTSVCIYMKKCRSSQLCAIGSVLGPLLFRLYTAEIIKTVEEHGLSSHFYADDSQLYFHCRPENYLSETTLSCTSDICLQMSSNRLRSNPSKTEFLRCATSRRIHQIDDGSFHVGDVDVKPSPAVRNLGVMMKGDLSMTAHVNRIVGQCFYSFRKIKLIRRSLSADATVTLVTSRIRSRIDYYNTIFAGLPDNTIDRLQSVLHAAAASSRACETMITSHLPLETSFTGCQ